MSQPNSEILAAAMTLSAAREVRTQAVLEGNMLRGIAAQQIVAAASDELDALIHSELRGRVLANLVAEGGLIGSVAAELLAAG